MSRIRRIFEIKYAQPYALRQALSMFRAQMNPDPTSRFLSIRAPKEIISAIEDAIKRLDVQSPPGRNAELTAYVLLASDQAAVVNALPASLEPVAAQLRNVLAYKNFQLLDTLIARGSDGRDVQLRGVLELAGVTMPTTYSMQGKFRSTIATTRFRSSRSRICVSRCRRR